jgi:predicted glycosyltransferase
LDRHRPVVVCRETEWQSTYVEGDIVGQVAAALQRRHPRWQVISIPRYRPHPMYDVPSLLAQADLFIGGGGTMCIEAAYYGTSTARP